MRPAVGDGVVLAADGADADAAERKDPGFLLIKRSDGTRPPSAKNMSSSKMPESGSSMPSALCIAFDVRPIL
jgi:hypothetical protein